MKEYLISLIQNLKSPIQARNQAREYLQALILQSLQRAGAMTSLAFHGGTALRFLYDLPRYSEDLDFALERHPATYDFRALLQAIRRDLEVQGYQVSVKVNDQKTVHSAFVRFSGLLYELKLSPHADEVLAVKLEVDTNPPTGASLATTLVRHYTLLNLQHHDQASLLAGKLHALLQRPYVKGRDIYDLLWYLSDRNWPPPNLIMLNNALAQSGWDGPVMTPANWSSTLFTRIENLPWEQVLDDVLPFLSQQDEAALLTKENILQLIRAARP